MTRKAKRSVGNRAEASRTMPPSIKKFRIHSWYDHYGDRPDEYTTWILTELGRLGLELDEVERSDRPPHRQTVLSDLLEWMSTHPSEAYARLVDWQRLDFAILKDRLAVNSAARPRIELTAEITKMNNLSVRWHPYGWRESEFAWGRRDHHDVNKITHRTFKEPPDFHWFEGDEEPWFDQRASNELMFIRGVGNLRPEPREEYGPYAKYNRDVLDSLLICAVRAGYGRLIEQLRLSFEVTLLDDFHFETREEPTNETALIGPDTRVVSWSLKPMNGPTDMLDQESSSTS